jgi:arabinogalactan oligomer/maltooligosaccharide transport system substrate-binding protein
VKRIFSLLLVFIMVVGVLAACGPQEDTSGNDKETTQDTTDNEANKDTEATKPEKLVIWEDKEKGVGLEAAIKSFEEEFGIKVEYKELDMATTMREQFRLDAPAGTGPDILTLPHDQIGQLATEGLLAPLDVDSSVIDIYTESSIQAETFNGELYGLPKATETPIFIYNKAHMDKAPETFDELYQFSKDFTKDGQYGYLALYDNFYFGFSVIGGNGGYVFANEDGTLNPDDIGLNNAGAVEGAQYIQKWYEEGLFPVGIIGESGGSAKSALFNEGKVASMMDGPWAFQGLRDIGIDFGVAPMPKLPNGEYPKTFIGVKGWHVSQYATDKEWATKLAVWIANEENAKIRFEETAEIPPVKSLINDPIIAENEGAQAVAIQSSRGIPMPNIPEMSQVWGPMASALQLVAAGEQEPEAALNDAVELIQQQIESTR